MISEDDKIRSMNRNDNITEKFIDRQTQDTTEEVDFQLLFDSLDKIFNEDIDEKTIEYDQTKSPTSINPPFVRLIFDLYRNTSWSQISQINEVRPHACMICVSINCEHIDSGDTRLNVEQVLDKALEKCNHEIADEWLFDDICSKCIMISCETVTFNEQPELHILWDETDLMQFYNWINKIDNDSTLVN